MKRKKYDWNIMLLVLLMAAGASGLWDALRVEKSWVEQI